MKFSVHFALASFLSVGVVQACDFQTKPAAVHQYYRSDGWMLPPVERGKLTAPVTSSGPGPSSAALKFGPGLVPGLTTRVIIHDATAVEPNIFEIPQQDFEQDGKRGIMSSQLMAIDSMIWRYDVDGAVVAYTVGLTPIDAHREKGKWKIDSEVACTFYATFVDDSGDGVFRLLIPGWMKPDLIPQWALKRDPA